MAKRDEAALEALTEDERTALKEADAEDGVSAEDAAAAEADAAVKEATAAADADAKEAAEADEKATAEAKAAEDAKAEEAKGAADKSAADEAAAKEAKAAEKAEAAEKAAKPADEAPARTGAPRWEAPEDVDVKLKEIDTKQGELADRFDNGDLTAREFNDEKVVLDDQRFDLKIAVEKAGMSDDFRKAAWIDQTVPDFIAKNPAYEGKANPTLNAMLDTEVRRLQQVALEDGKDPLSASILDEADKAITKAVRALSGKGPAEAEADPAEEDAKNKGESAAKAAGARPAAPRTLAKVPASDISETGEGRFSGLDRLSNENPIAFEDAMAKLPEAERERYLQSH